MSGSSGDSPAGADGSGSGTGTGSDVASETSAASEDDEDSGDEGIKFDQGASDESGGTPTCDADRIVDTLAFTFVKSIDLGIEVLQAGCYDSTRRRVVVFSFSGPGRVLDIDGNITAQIMAPPEALPALDGGAYDLANDVILLVNQACSLVEVDPETFTTLSVTELGAAHDVSICAGIAIDPMSNLYITSYGTDELVVVDRTGQNELFRVDMAAIGMSGFDGIAEIAGSENFLVNSTTQRTAAIIAADGSLVAGPGAIGMMPIMGGGEVGQPDSMLTICDNGHTWVCDAYETTCSDFAPTDGDKMACGCLIAG